MIICRILFVLVLAFWSASSRASATRDNDGYAWTGHYNVTRSYTTNTLDQYSRTTLRTLSWDGRGNLARSGPNSYSHDSENRLITARQVSLTHDALGRLVSQCLPLRQPAFCSACTARAASAKLMPDTVAAFRCATGSIPFPISTLAFSAASRASRSDIVLAGPKDRSRRLPARV
jgi:hypothetical protein